MELEFWGTRGTCPVSGRKTAGCGGNTACASLAVSPEELIIIDAGTGLRNLGRKLKESSRTERLEIHLLLTHFHLDHVWGLPFFEPLYSDRTVVTFYADEEPEETERLLASLMSRRLFPLEFSELRSRRRFKTLPAGRMHLGGVDVSYQPLTHPQGSVAYRLDGRHGSIVFATDTEHPLKGADEALIGFSRGAEHFVCDSTYTPEEYEDGRRGWGHSTWEAGVKLAEAAGVKNLLLSHHNPDHDDRAVGGIVRRARRRFPRTQAAREGLKLRI
ncbi:MAG: MBL fold metallo-hydrolase [Candidatus Aminicenantes bacterium]|nr:MBL fold metallo-hydrolase [Candidatus Aminicenantes bacterium]